MTIWVAIDSDSRALVQLWRGKNKPLNCWIFWRGEFNYFAETERQAREALIERLQSRVREYESIIAVEKSRLV